jgi:hypothetical protein
MNAPQAEGQCCQGGGPDECESPDLGDGGNGGDTGVDK